MAIARGAGTEIIRSHHFEDLSGDNGDHDLILGVQHHIYTVLSVIITCTLRASDTHHARLRIMGYDSYGGTTAQEIIICRSVIALNDTFVWNDKFSFNGYEPVNFTGPLSTIAEQDAIADQGNTGTFPTGSQQLNLFTSDASTNYDVTVTFIDQNNA
jgi:hypothetical protein